MGEEAETTYQRGLSHLLADETAGFAMAMRCFERAAERGHAGAQYGLAACYLSDEPKSGHAADPVTAVRWLERAAQQQHAAAQHELGLCFASGNGVTQDLSAAAAWPCNSHSLAQSPRPCRRILDPSCERGLPCAAPPASDFSFVFSTGTSPSFALRKTNRLINRSAWPAWQRRESSSGGVALASSRGDQSLFVLNIQALTDRASLLANALHDLSGIPRLSLRRAPVATLTKRVKLPDSTCKTRFDCPYLVIHICITPYITSYIFASRMTKSINHPSKNKRNRLTKDHHST